MKQPKTNEKYAGVWTAITTPFDDKLEIDFTCFDLLLSKQKDAGVSGVVVCGTTGEAPTLTTDEKLALIAAARKQLPSEIRVMAGTGGNNTSESISLSIKAVEAGADSLLIVTPPYNKPSTNGLMLHYESIAKSVDVPLCLYHVPGRTAHRLTEDQIAKICEIEKVECVKEASGDIAFFSRAYQKTNVSFLSGDDPTYLASLAVGGCGAISVLSNIFPKELVALTKAYREKDTDLALKLHNILLPVTDSLFCEVNPCPAKAAIEIMGWAKNTVRAPLAPVTRESYEHIKNSIADAQKKLEGIDL